MNTAKVDAIVNAVLYEGYMLYPYRPSAVKNRQRFNFGVIYPQAYSESQGGTDACTMQTECLVQGNPEMRCAIQVRFLRMMSRSIGKLGVPVLDLESVSEENIEIVERLEVNGKSFHSWLEAVEEEIEVPEANAADLVWQPIQWPFRLSAKLEREAIRDQQGLIVGIIFRNKASVAGMIELTAQRMQQGFFKLRIHISNVSRLEEAGAVSREQALQRSLVSTHTILQARDGRFISLVDPPDEFRDVAKTCHNAGTWPVLVGKEGEQDMMLSSPIILYDYPEIAPESPGNLFDGGEIDEILSLRILTMTEDEKREMRESDDRTRQILERTEALPDEQLAKLHGALRGLRRVRGEEP